jgi:excisionase family DNA binding protein
MEVITIESKAFKTLSDRFERIESVLEELRQLDKSEIKPLSSTEVCKYLQISRRTLARLTASGELAYSKSGRKLLFFHSDLENFLMQRKEGGEQ